MSAVVDSYSPCHFDKAAQRYLLESLTSRKSSVYLQPSQAFSSDVRKRDSHNESTGKESIPDPTTRFLVERLTGGFYAPRKVRSLVKNRRLMQQAPRLLREQMLKLDRQHQLRSEALVWRGQKDYMHGPIVHTTPE